MTKISNAPGRGQGISDYDRGLIEGLEVAGLLAPSGEAGKWDITPFFRWIIMDRPVVAKAVDYSIISYLGGELGVISEESGDWQEEYFSRELGTAPPAEVINIADHMNKDDEH
jgi:hypothetical protein